MQYRELGKTGIQVSEIGIGCEGFSGKTQEECQELMDACFAAGVNCMDLYAPDPQLRSNIGQALQGRRDQFVLQAHLCTEWKNGQYQRTRAIEAVRASFDDLLARLQTDYVDIGMIHYVDSLEDWHQVEQGPVMAYAQECKRSGKIRHIGLSSHNPQVALQAVNSGKIEVLMFSVNPCYDLLPGDEDCEKLWDSSSYQAPLLNLDPQREALYETCQRQGVGIIVMKVFGGGGLLTGQSPAGKALTPCQCLHYALTRPAVAAVMAGAHNEEQLKDCVAYESADPAQRDYAAAFAALPKMSWQGHCMYCGHCAPCPKGIDVASVTKFWNLCKAQGEIPETVREHYGALAHHAGECIACSSCEKRCPFGVPVVENMRQAAAVFGN